MKLAKLFASGSYAANILRKQMFAKSAKTEPALEKLKKIQAHFQKDNGLPVFLKGGSNDAILYRGTMGLCILGLLLNVKLYIDLAIGRHIEEA